MIGIHIHIMEGIMEGQREAKPLLYNLSPSPLKERGIKGVRLIISHKLTSLLGTGNIEGKWCPDFVCFR